MEKNKKKYSKEYMRALGSRGGRRTVHKYGKEYMRKLALKRWRKDLGGGELNANQFRYAIKKGFYVPVVMDADVDAFVAMFPRSAFVRYSLAQEVFSNHPDLFQKQLHLKEEYEQQADNISGNSSGNATESPDKTGK